jgi:hypothetical protein
MVVSNVCVCVLLLEFARKKSQLVATLLWIDTVCLFVFLWKYVLFQCCSICTAYYNQSINQINLHLCLSLSLAPVGIVKEIGREKKRLMSKQRPSKGARDFRLQFFIFDVLFLVSQQQLLPVGGFFHRLTVL